MIKNNIIKELKPLDVIESSDKNRAVVDIIAKDYVITTFRKQDFSKKQRMIFSYEDIILGFEKFGRKKLEKVKIKIEEVREAFGFNIMNMNTKYVQKINQTEEITTIKSKNEIEKGDIIEYKDNFYIFYDFVNFDNVDYLITSRGYSTTKELLKQKTEPEIIIQYGQNLQKVNRAISIKDITDKFNITNPFLFDIL